MQKRFATTFLAIALIAVMMIGMQIEPADAKKAQGTYVQKFGSATKNIVCGDRLCSESDTPKQASEITTESIKTTKNTCNSNSIQIESNCLSFSIKSAKIQDSTYDSNSGSTTIQILSAENGRLTINAENSLLKSIFILVDNEEWDDVIIDGPKMTIDFFAGTETIEIFGN